MRPSFLVPAASILAAAHLAAAHGAGHAHGASYDDHGAEVGNMGYAERHVSVKACWLRMGGRQREI